MQRVILLENDLSAEKAKTLEMLDQIAILESKLKKVRVPCMVVVGTEARRLMKVAITT